MTKALTVSIRDDQYSFLKAKRKYKKISASGLLQEAIDKEIERDKEEDS
jgi:post-segregation antitoxin (ccd killing protein)